METEPRTLTCKACAQPSEPPPCPQGIKFSQMHSVILLSRWRRTRRLTDSWGNFGALFLGLTQHCWGQCLGFHAVLGMEPVARAGESFTLTLGACHQPHLELELWECNEKCRRRRLKKLI